MAQVSLSIYTLNSLPTEKFFMSFLSSAAFFFKNNYFEKFVQKYHQSVK